MASDSLPIYIVDAFTKKKFSGNSAAVCFVDFDQIISTDKMQKIASEMNLSVTAFVSLVNQEDSFQESTIFFLRWFTPTCELSVCGHATLATAFLLMNTYGNKTDDLMFDTKGGKILVWRAGEGMVAIDLLGYAPYQVEKGKYSTLVKAVTKDLAVEEVLMSAPGNLLIRLSDSVTREQLESLRPNDQNLLSASDDSQLLGVIVTRRGDAVDCVNDDGEQYDFISRYFAPWIGISEDSVTGSSHSVLGPYWAKLLKKRELFARQCSSRGGELRISVMDCEIVLRGHAVVIVEGKLNV